MYKIGIDIGGTNSRLGLFDSELEMVEYFEKPTLGSEDPRQTLDELINHINDWKTKYVIQTIGIGCPGPSDLINGVILTPQNIPAWQGFEIVKYFQTETGIEKIKLENDANANGLAQAIVGPGHGAQNCVYVTVSTGVGVGLVINGKVYSGSHGNAAEVDRFLIDFDTNLEMNENYGIEGALSGTGILASAQKHGLDVTSTKEVFDLYNKDEIATKVINYAIKSGGLFIHNLMMAYDPEYIIFGGSVVTKNPWMLDEMVNITKKYARPEFIENVKVVLTELDDGGVIGAALSI